jgi:hypothetical protein
MSPSDSKKLLREGTDEECGVIYVKKGGGFGLKKPDRGVFIEKRTSL